MRLTAGARWAWLLLILVPQRKALQMREDDPVRMRQRLIEIVRRSRERTERVTVTRRAKAPGQTAKTLERTLEHGNRNATG